MAVEKEERGMSLSQIRAVVDQVLAERQERDKTSQELGQIRKEVTELKGEFGKVKQGMHCTKDGKYCFSTPEELAQFMASQKEKMDGVEAKIGEVATQIKEMAESKTPAPEGPALVGIPKGGFDKLPVEQQNKLRAQIDTQIPHATLMQILKECSRSDSPEKCNLLRSILRDHDAEEIVAELPKDKGSKVVSIQCQDGECRLELEKEGVRIYRKDEKGRWFWQDEPKDEGSHF